MSVKIRLARHGRRKAPYYRMVVADSRCPRDGRFIEILGIYQPLNKKPEDQIRINEEKAIKWLNDGAMPSDTCRSLLSKQGIMKNYHDAKMAVRLAAKAEKAAKAE